MNFKYELYRPSEDIVNDGMKTIDDYRFQEEPYKKSFTSNNKVYNKFINIIRIHILSYIESEVLSE